MLGNPLFECDSAVPRLPGAAMQPCRIRTAASLLVLLTAPVAAQSRPVSGAPVLPRRAVVNGITLLTHRADAFERAPQWSLELEPIGTAGGAAAPDYDLTYVANVEILSD